MIGKRDPLGRGAYPSRMGGRHALTLFSFCVLGAACRSTKDEHAAVAPALEGIALKDASPPLPPPGTAPADGASADNACKSGAQGIHHVVSTGQSLAVGAEGYPPFNTFQPFRNVMFVSASGGPLAGSGELAKKKGVFVPLVEKPFETPWSAFANLTSELAARAHVVPDPAAYRMLVSVHGVGSYAYTRLKRGSATYKAALAHVELGKALAASIGESYTVPAVALIHGESDHVERNPKYATDLREWQADYERDIRALSGQSEPVPMFESQTSSFTRYGQSTSAIPQAQLDAATSSEGKIILVGAKYHLPYAADGIHLTTEGYRQLGEEFAKAYARVILECGRWEPLRPLRAEQKESDVRVHFIVPSPPLVFDTNAVTDPGHYGFEITDTKGATLNIAEATIEGDSVVLHLAQPPTSPLRVRYALTGTPRAAAGPKTGARGNLRDSDATLGRTGTHLYNWAVHFEMRVE